ncbi:RNA helicase [Entamoeba marina]
MKKTIPTKVIDESGNGCHSYNDYDDMNFKVELLRGIYSHGFEKPSEIQKLGIVPIFQNRNVIIQAYSGSGKTACFVIGCLQLIDSNVKNVQSIILAPTRELAYNIMGMSQSISEFLPINICLCVGGISMRENIEALRNGAQLIIGTPGRVFYLILNGFLDVEDTKKVVFDEVDWMLDMGFHDEITQIFKYISNATYVLVHATDMYDFQRLVQKYIDNPIRIISSKEVYTLDEIKQYYVNVATEDDKVVEVINFCKSLNHIKIVIYCNIARIAESLHNVLQKEGYKTTYINPNFRIEQMQTSLNDFRNSISNILIIPDTFLKEDLGIFSLHINFNFPRNKEQYLVRIRQSCRNENVVTIINFSTPDELNLLEDIKNYYSLQIEPLPLNITFS